jgi:ABC-type lipoprotein release transport system permease subunit
MGFIMRFAFKNIWRYKRRTIITFTAISIGIVAFIFMDSLLKGIHYESLRNFIDYESSHLKIYNKEFYKEMSDDGFLPLDKAIDNYESVENLIQSDDILVTPRINFRSQIVNEATSDERPFTIVGIDPDKDRKVYKLPDVIMSGRFLKSGERGVLIGRISAEKLETKLGDTLTILTRTKNDTYQTISVDVVGIIDPPNPDINKTFAYIPLDIAYSDLDMMGSVTEIGIRIKNGNESKILNRLDGILKANNLSQLEVVSWKELGKDWLTLSKTKIAGSYIMILVVFIISAVGVINTMLMSVFERIREIGMMRALGMRDTEVIWSFFFEGASIGFLGGLIGIFIGLLLNLYLIYHGLDLSYTGDVDISYRVMNIVRGVWDVGAIVFAFVFSVIIPALISIYPSRKAIKMEITQALKTA